MTTETRVAILESVGMAMPYSKTKPLSIKSAELDSPGPDEVLVKILAAGICHSDLSVINGDRPRPTPMVLGHEAVGEVVKTGSNVSDLKNGVRVALVFVPSCGHCDFCSGGRPALCEPAFRASMKGTLLSGGVRIRVAGKPVLHHLGVSCFADFAVCHRRSLIPISPKTEPVVQAVFGCAVLTGCGSIIRTAKLDIGERVGIVGLGGVGLAALLGARASGAGLIIAIDSDDSKKEISMQLGADFFFNSLDPESSPKIRDLTNGGVEIAAEFAGVMPALEFALGITRRGGRTVSASLPNPSDRLSVPVAALVAEERSLLGSYVGSSIPSRDLPAYLSLHESGRLPVEKLITGTIRLNEINFGMQRLAEGKAVRQIVQFK